MSVRTCRKDLASRHCPKCTAEFTPVMSNQIACDACRFAPRPPLQHKCVWCKVRYIPIKQTQRRCPECLGIAPTPKIAKATPRKVRAKNHVGRNVSHCSTCQHGKASPVGYEGWECALVKAGTCKPWNLKPELYVAKDGK